MEIIGPNIKKAVRALEEGKVLVCPTDTVYGLICDFNNKKAIKKIYKIKKRPKWKFLPVFVDSIKMARKLVKISPEQEKFLKKVWPGKITAVFDYKKPGLRIPDNKFALNLIKRIGPLAETSANISGKPASTKISNVLAQFKSRKDKPDLVIDAGDLPPSKPSKVIDLTIWPPKVLRS